MLIKVLGSAAGGGLPQWNCNGRNSADARRGAAWIKPRTQASVAVSAEGKQWVLLNAAPDLRQQINDTRELHPAPDQGPRNSPIKAVVLTNGDVDAIAGLLCLREGQPFTVYGTPRVLGVLASNSVFDVLDSRLVRRLPMTYGEPFSVEGPQGPVGIGPHQRATISLDLAAAINTLIVLEPVLEFQASQTRYSYSTPSGLVRTGGLMSLESFDPDADGFGYASGGAMFQQQQQSLITTVDGVRYCT